MIEPKLQTIGRQRRSGVPSLAILFTLWAAVSCSGDREEGPDREPIADQEEASASRQPDAPTPHTNRADESGEPLRTRLTPEYLEGDWCATLSQERSRYTFAEDGSYRATVPGYRQEAEGTLEALLERHPVIRQVGADRFILARTERGGFPYVFERGPC